MAREPKLRKSRADRYGTPDDATNKLTYSDEQGNRLSSNDWLERVKADAAKAKRKKP